MKATYHELLIDVNRSLVKAERELAEAEYRVRELKKAKRLYEMQGRRDFFDRDGFYRSA